MRLQLTTPKNRRTLLIYGVLLIMVQPAFTVAHYAWNEAFNPYPWEADSLAIPIFSEILFWFFFAPFALLTVVRATRDYHKKLPIWQIKTLKRQLLGINIAFGLLLGFTLGQLLEVFTYSNIPVLIDVALCTYLVLALRANVIANWHSQPQK